MSTRRLTSTDVCPLFDLPVAMSVCGECRFFRGAASSSHEKRGWDICCNWPRNGAEIARERPGTETVPAIFQEAFE